MCNNVVSVLKKRPYREVQRYAIVLQHSYCTWNNVYYRKIHDLTREFHVKFHLKNRYRTNREAIRAISVFQVKFNVEFTSQVMDFP